MLARAAPGARAPASPAAQASARCGGRARAHHCALSAFITACRPASAPLRALPARRPRCAHAQGRAARVACAVTGSCDASGGDADAPRAQTALAPLQPSSTAGTRLQQCLSQLSTRRDFELLLRAHLEVLAADEEAEQIRTQLRAPPRSPADDALASRLRELRQQQRTAALTDALYNMVLSKLLGVGLTLTPPLASASACQSDNEPPPARSGHADALLSLLSAEAAQVVRAHAAAAVEGGGPCLPGDAVVRCATAQLAQAYVTACTLGYFVRAVDYRFRLDRQLRTLPPGAHAPRDADATSAQQRQWPFAAALRKLVAPRGADAPQQAGDAQAFSAYISSFREAELLGSLLEGMSAETKALMLRHVSALLGDVPQLHTDFAAAHGEALLAAARDGQPAQAAAEALQAAAARVRDDVESNRLKSVRLRVADLHALVHEAAVVGALLRDAEATVRAHGLLRSTNK